MGILLFLISFILVVSLSWIGIFFMTLASLFSWNRSYIKGYWQKLAISLDQFGNVAMAGLFNTVLIKISEHPFGDPDETISSVIGKNKLANKLTWLGRRLDYILDKFDPNHSIKSIEN